MSKHWETSVGKSDEWYTPKYVFEALDTWFDMDVAAPKDPSKTFVPALNFISENSLETEWKGFIWMNPPFGGRNGVVPWLEKFRHHRNGIALVPDRTSAGWFQDIWLNFAGSTGAVLFTRKIKFLTPDGIEGKSPTTGTALMAMGREGVRALNQAAMNGLGILAEPIFAGPSSHSRKLMGYL